MSAKLWAKYNMWKIARSIKIEDGAKEVFESNLNIIPKAELFARLPEVADIECSQASGRCGAKLEFAKEILYSDGSFSSIEIRTDEETQRALKNHEVNVREATWRANHPNSST